jgi:hypothetical protein
MREQIMTAAEIQKHFDRIAKDARMRALAQSCVALAMQEYGPVDPERADRDAHDIASLAAHLLVSRIYTEDSELRGLKEENERLRQMAFETARTTPPKLVVTR